MSISTDKDHFFQTSASLEQAERRAAKASNTNGSPIDVGSKILDIIPDPKSNSHVFLALSAGLARRLDLSSSDDKVKHTYKGHTAPVTCLAINHTGTILFTGSWDKTIRSFDILTREPLVIFTGHTDFVKCLLYLPPHPNQPANNGLLVSGSSDASIIIWDPATGRKLQVLKGHPRGVTSLALDPLSPPGSYTVFSGGTVREIRQWTISADGSSASEASEYDPIIAHETSVYKLRFSGDEFEELWTASADGFAKCIDIRNTRKPGAEPAGSGLRHPDFVNDVLLVAEKWVVTACRDEHVRVWEKQTGKLWHVFEGHYEEVSGLCLRGWEVVSVSIDGTVRRWSLEPSALKRAVEEAKLNVDKERQEQEQEQVKESVLTAEEEAELAELMEDDD